MPFLKRAITVLTLIILVSSIVGLSSQATASVLQQPPTDANNGQGPTGSTNQNNNGNKSDPCANTTSGGDTADPSKVQNCIQQTAAVHDIQIIVDWLSAGVGVVVAGVIILGGIQYIAAGDSPEGIKAARQRMVNGVIALVVFMFLFAFVQWLIPGGIFK